MTAYTTYPNGASTNLPAHMGSHAGAPAPTYIRNTFNAGKRPLVAADTVAIITIPAGTLVEQVHYTILAAEVVAAQTLHIGDATDPDGFIAGLSTSAAAGTTGVGAGAYITAAGKYYATATDLLLTVPAAMAGTTFEIEVTVVGHVL